MAGLAACWFVLQFGAVRVFAHLPAGIVATGATLAWWAGTAAAAWALARRRDRLRPGLLDRPGPVVAFVALLAAFALVAYPVFDGRRAQNAGSDADDAVQLVIEGVLDGVDPFATDTYLGSPPSTGPGSALWYVAFPGDLFALGGVAAVGITLVLVRRANGRWTEATLMAGLLASSPSFWEGIAQGSDHLPFACALVWATVVVGDRAGHLAPRPAALWGAIIGALSTFRSPFLFVPALAASGRLWRDRRGAAIFAGAGTLTALGLHAALLTRTTWDGYTPVQQLLVKSEEDLTAAGRVLVVAGVLAALAVVVAELRRPMPRTSRLLLAGAGFPMVAIALANLEFTRTPLLWSAGNYFLDAIVLAAFVAATALAPRRAA